MCLLYLFVEFEFKFIAKCHYTDCTRNVLWCQVHSSHIHSNHKTFNYCVVWSVECNVRVIVRITHVRRLHWKAGWPRLSFYYYYDDDDDGDDDDDNDDDDDDRCCCFV